jgi:hypothetical protein
MIYVALALVAANAGLVAAFANLLRSQQRSQARERDLLLNQVMHLSGKPWQPAPADERPEPTPPPDPRPPRYTASPEAFSPDFVADGLGN